MDEEAPVIEEPVAVTEVVKVAICDGLLRLFFFPLAIMGLSCDCEREQSIKLLHRY